MSTTRKTDKKAHSEARAIMVSKTAVPPREGPRPTLQEFLDEWIEKGPEIFIKDQLIHPAYIGWLPDNSQLILTMPKIGDKQEQQVFSVGSENILQEAGAVMVLRVAEAWASENLSMSASKAQDRTEVVIFKAEDDESERLAMLKINRDWRSGKVTLGEPEYGQ